MAEGPRATPGRGKVPVYRETFFINRLSIAIPILVIVILAAAFKMLTPKGALLAGDVAGSHAQFELKCNACHTPWQGPTDRACQSCHKPELLRDHAPGWNLPGDHGLKMLDCKHCHVEHHGRTFDLKANASQDCVLCHGFTSTGEGHPEVRAVSDKLYEQQSQNGFRQFRHSSHLDRPHWSDKDPNHPDQFRKLECRDCHTVQGRVVKDTHEVKFETKCKPCHEAQLGITLSRGNSKTVQHGQVPKPEDHKDLGLTKAQEFLMWNGDQSCGMCHVLQPLADPRHPGDINIDVLHGDRPLLSEASWIKIQHWGYSEFKHKKHLDQDYPLDKSRKLRCTDCHNSSDQYVTLASPSFDRHCIQCHAGNLAIPYPSRRDHKAVTHPDVPTFASTTDKAQVAKELEEARMWVGLDDKGIPLAGTESETRRCAMCHLIGVLELAAAQTGDLVNPSRALGQHAAHGGSWYANLEPLLAQASSPTAAPASSSPSGSPSPSAAASPLASPSASPAATESPSPSATESASPAAAATESPSASPPAPAATPSPGAAPGEAVGSQAVVVPPPLPEDKWANMDKLFKVRVIAPVGPPASLVLGFVHKPHLTLMKMKCEECHQLVNIGDRAGPGTFDMQMLPEINKCGQCHNNATNGVNNQCGYCHAFHDKTLKTLPVMVTPEQTSRPPGGVMAHVWGRTPAAALLGLRQ